MKEMAEQIDSSKIGENPELIRTFLGNLGKAIASGVSQNMFDSVVPSLKCKDRGMVLKQQKDDALRLIEEHTDYMLKYTEIEKHLEVLRKLEQLEPKDSIAWRPTTGDVEYSTFEGNFLAHKKKQLVNSICQIQEESREVQKLVHDKRCAIVKQLKEVQEAEVKLDEIYTCMNTLEES